MPKFEKSRGLTTSEKYLAQLCEKSFLSLWSYPNLFRNDGKELCDLLILFGNHVIIFSDKSCVFPNTGNIELDWKRWLKKAILKSADQTAGAERYIRSCPSQIYLDAKRAQQFPFNFPPIDNIRFHRIVVAVGAEERCRAYFRDGPGSLLIDPILSIDEHTKTKETLSPFIIGRTRPSRGYIHIFDTFGLDTTLHELDTINDFVEYLEKKETFLLSGRCRFAYGEQDLLAYYLSHIDGNGRHNFVLPEQSQVIFNPNQWVDYIQDPKYISKKNADKISYAWDKLIELFAKDVASENLAFSTAQGLADHERALRAMAAEPRFSRRLLSEALLEALAKGANHNWLGRLTLSPSNPRTCYVFLIFSIPQNESYKDYRTRRTFYLHAYCKIAKIQNPDISTIVGIASEPKGSLGSSQDLIYVDATNWSEGDQKEAVMLQNELKIMQPENIVQIRTHHEEYPRLAESELLKHRVTRQQKRALARKNRERKAD